MEVLAAVVLGWFIKVGLEDIAKAIREK